MRELCEIMGGGEKLIKVMIDEISGQECVSFIGDADIDADGANGQHALKPAYNKDDTGSEALANGGMFRTSDGEVWFRHNWGQDIVIMNGLGQPKVFPSGIIASKTAYKFPDKTWDDPDAFLDSESVPYIVIPPQLRIMPMGVVMGCFADVTNIETGTRVEAMVGDIGPRTKAGEVSILLARLLGIPSSPRTGGEDRPIIQYRFWTNRQFYLNGFRFPLIPFGK